MKLGVTGTHKGLTPQQWTTLLEMVGSEPIDELHHGDCVGVDAQVHRAVYGGTLARIILHPPVKDRSRAFCVANEERPPRPYLDRNHDIVDESEIIWAFPETSTEQLRSGTWATVRYARKVGVPVVLINPDGSVVR